jgi:hypothetical protein
MRNNFLRCARHRFTMPRLIVLVFLLAGHFILAHGAGSEAPAHNVDGSFVKEWLVLGPFSSKDLDTDFLAEAGGEANVRPKVGDTFTTKDGKQLVWTRLRSKHDIVNLEEVFGIQDWSIAYAYCELNSDQSIETDLRASSVLPSPLWINGTKVGQVPDVLHKRHDLHPVLPFKLNAGRNACLLKLKIESSHSLAFEFQPLPAGRATAELHVTDPGGRNVANALIKIYDRGEPVARLHTGDSGKAEACLYPLAAKYDVQITSGQMGAWLYDVALRPGERRKLQVVLTNAISISGRVLAMDGSPQPAIVVQAIHVLDEIAPAAPTNHDDTASVPRVTPGGYMKSPPLLRMPAFSETAHTDSNGVFRLINLKPGPYRRVRTNPGRRHVRLSRGQERGLDKIPDPKRADGSRAANDPSNTRWHALGGNRRWHSSSVRRGGVRDLLHAGKSREAHNARRERDTVDRLEHGY